jgi:DNA-binding NtrC family response regulator
MARILIIDDDSKVLGTYSRILERAGYEVVTAVDGNEYYQHRGIC